jgi:LacI family transcriptional regulator
MEKKKLQRAKKTATIVDVAQKAGVSVATASRVLSGRGYASEGVKERVRSAARQLNYRMNAAARNLKVKRTDTIGLIITDIVNPFYSYLANGVLACAKQLGYHVLLCATDEDPERECEYLKVLMEQRVDGIIAVPTGHNHKLWREVLDMNSHLVLLDREIHGISPVDTVLVDNVHGARAAIEYLIQLGHRRIGIVCGSLDTTTGRDRLQGYYSALQAASLPIDANLVQGDSYSRDSGYRAIQVLFSLADPPTAIFVSSNVLGEVVFSAIRERSLRIPDDVSFIMFDDVPWATLVEPAITVVRQPVHSLGYTGLKLLDQRLKEADQGEVQTPVKVTMGPELVVRQSCLPLSVPHAVVSAGTN